MKTGHENGRPGKMIRHASKWCLIGCLASGACSPGAPELARGDDGNRSTVSGVSPGTVSVDLPMVASSPLVRRWQIEAGIAVDPSSKKPEDEAKAAAAREDKQRNDQRDRLVQGIDMTIRDIDGVLQRIRAQFEGGLNDLDRMRRNAYLAATNPDADISFEEGPNISDLIEVQATVMTEKFGLESLRHLIEGQPSEETKNYVLQEIQRVRNEFGLAPLPPLSKESQQKSRNRQLVVKPDTGLPANPLGDRALCCEAAKVILDILSRESDASVAMRKVRGVFAYDGRLPLVGVQIRLDATDEATGEWSVASTHSLGERRTVKFPECEATLQEGKAELKDQADNTDARNVDIDRIEATREVDGRVISVELIVLR